MDNILKVIDLCENYLKGGYTIEEFQQRILTLRMSEISNDIHKLLSVLDNQLEEIRFSHDESEHLGLSSQIVSEFLSTILLYTYEN